MQALSLWWYEVAVARVQTHWDEKKVFYLYDGIEGFVAAVEANHKLDWESEQDMKKTWNFMPW